MKHERTSDRLLRRYIRETLREARHSHVRQGYYVMNEGMDGLFRRHGLTEDYCVGVLGIDRTALVEGRWNAAIDGVILAEHLLFEGWWGDLKDKIKKITKDSPITSVTDALKKFGRGVKGVIAAIDIQSLSWVSGQGRDNT